MQTLQNILSKIDFINQTSGQMLSNHPDGELEILEMFQKVLPEIENGDQVVFEGGDGAEMIENILQSIANEHKFDQFKNGVTNYFFEPWNKVKTSISQVNAFFHKFKQFVKKQVYVDEVIIDDFVQNHNSSKNLAVIQNLLIPESHSEGLFYRLYLATKYQVVL